ncbi:unnamed protein product [Chrysoparadoxa australica]
MQRRRSLLLAAVASCTWHIVYGFYGMKMTPAHRSAHGLQQSELPPTGNTDQSEKGEELVSISARPKTGTSDAAEQPKLGPSMVPRAGADSVSKPRPKRGSTSTQPPKGSAVSKSMPRSASISKSEGGNNTSKVKAIKATQAAVKATDKAAKEAFEVKPKGSKVTSLHSSSPSPKRLRTSHLVVKKDTDVQSLLEEVLDRLSANEREMKALKARFGVKREGIKSSTSFVLDSRATTYGAAVAGGFFGLVLGWSVYVKLAFAGAVAGAATCAYFATVEGRLGRICKDMGTQVALVFKDVKDFYDQTIFLYKTGKLSYTYWKVFDKYDVQWGLTDKYMTAMTRISEEAKELDRQYKIRNKVLTIGKQAGSLAQEVASSTVSSLNTAMATATGWGSRQLEDWQGEDTSSLRKRKKKKRRRGEIPLNSPPLKRDSGRGGFSRALKAVVKSPEQKKREDLRKHRTGFLGFRPDL